MKKIGDRVRITDDHMKRFIGREGEVVAIHEETPTQCPFEVKLDAIGFELSVNRCYHASEFETL